jgi:hemerythrin-like domain-containing protein
MPVYTKLYRTQHQQLLALAGELAPLLVTSRARQEASKARAVLSRLIGALTVHLGMEDEGLYPLLLAQGDPAVREKARRFKEEMGGIRGAVEAFAARWPTEAAIAAQPEAFAAETRSILDALGKRIEREDGELFPLADRA